MISKVYSQNKSLWPIAAISLLFHQQCSLQFLNSSLWISSFFLLKVPLFTAAYSLCKRSITFDPLKPTLLQLVTLVSSIQLLISSLLPSSSRRAFNSPRHLRIYLCVLLKEWSHRVGTSGMRDQLKGWWLSLHFCFSTLQRFLVAPDHLLLPHFFLGWYLTLLSEFKSHPSPQEYQHGFSPIDMAHPTVLSAPKREG